MPHPFYDGERDADILARRLAGQSCSEIAKIYDISAERVRQIAHREVTGEPGWKGYIPTDNPKPRLDKLPPFTNPYKKTKTKT